MTQVTRIRYFSAYRAFCSILKSDCTQFPTPELLAEYSASVHDRRLIYDGPRYKALVLNNATSLELQSAQMLLSYAKSGLPIVVVGSIPSLPQSLCPTRRGTSSKLNAIFRSMLALRTTKQVELEAHVPVALQGLGVMYVAHSTIAQY